MHDRRTLASILSTFFNEVGWEKGAIAQRCDKRPYVVAWMFFCCSLTSNLPCDMQWLRPTRLMADARLLIAAYCCCLVLQAIFQEGYAFSPAPGCEPYTAPGEGPIDSHTSFIRGLPDAAPPEVGWRNDGACLRIYACLPHALPAVSADF